MNRYLPLILSGVLLNACAQLVLKQGMRNIGHFAFSIQNILPIGVKVALNPFVMAGILCYVMSVIVWLMVLSRVDVSYAYPLLSVGYIVTAFAGRFFFDEVLGPVCEVRFFAIFPPDHRPGRNRRGGGQPALRLADHCQGTPSFTFRVLNLFLLSLFLPFLLIL